MPCRLPARHLSPALRALLCCAALLPALAVAFGEENGSRLHAPQLASTHHLYLTRALAVCAGYAWNGREDPFSEPADAERIAIADQLTDSERLQQGERAFTLCTGRPYVMPGAAAAGCPAGSGERVIMPLRGEGHVTGWLPLPSWREAEGCFTSRFGPYSNDFHFPDAARLAELRAWAFGESTALAGTARFSFGGFLDSPWHADCHVARRETIDTGAVAPGSLEALGIYLHAIGDFHSHAQCLAHWGERRNPPWPTHTISTAQTGCAFVDHARELGCPANAAHDSLFAPAPEATYVQHAEAAAMAVFDALRARAQAAQPPHASRLGDGEAQRAWLGRHLRRFVTGWSWLEGAPARAAFAYRLAAHCAALQPGQTPADLPPQPGEASCPYAP